MNASHLRARYWRIVLFFGRVISGFIFWEMFAHRIGLGAYARRTRSERNRRTAVRFRALAVRMGGLMIKVGQFLSARLDILPSEITDELAGLQDEVPPETFAAIRMQAEAELGWPLHQAYAWFDEVPVAAASLGQVHRARLLPANAGEGGLTDVVVKVQRPHIEQIVEVDLAALRRVGGWIERYKPVRDRADVPALIEEFATTTREEIDYLAEGNNAETFAADFATDERIKVPQVVWDLTTRRVLTLEDVSAIKLGDHDAIRAAGIDPAQVASVLFDTYMKQIFEDGFFHADPHPGNLFVAPLETFDAGGNREWRLTFIDFGMVGRVPENLRLGLTEAVVAIGTQDGARLVKAFKTLDVLLPTADLGLIERASIQAFERFGGMSMGDLKNIDHSEMMRFGLQFQELMMDLPFQLPENLLLLGRSLAILSGMCSGLDPEFNIWSAIAPYATGLIGAEGGSTWDTLLGEGSKILQVVAGLPGRADRVLATIERGDLSVQTPMLDLQVRQLSRAARAVASAVVFAALLVAGAVLYPAAPVLARVFMFASAVPLIGVMMAGRRRHPGR